MRDVPQRAGNRMAEAEPAEVGIRPTRELQPAFALMDLPLPGLDGVTARAAR